MRLMLVRVILVLGLSSWPTVGRAQELIYGMTGTSSSSVAAGQNLVTFSSTTPGTVTTIGAFSGLIAGQSVRSIDFRPSTGQLYAVATSSATAAQLYTVNTTTAALTPVGSGFTLGTNSTAAIEIDFNPVTDQIRLITRGDNTVNNNFSVNPTTGALISTGGNLAYVTGDVQAGNPPSISGTAFSNAVGGATTLYGWDYNSDALVTLGGPGGTPSPETGQLNTVAEAAGFLTFNAGIGMTFGKTSNTLYVVHDDPATGAVSSLYTRDLTTGDETLIGSFAAGTFINDITIAPVPEPATVLAASTAVLLAGGCVRRRVRAGMLLVA